MIYVFTGDDEFSLEAALRGLKEALGEGAAREANVHDLDAEASFGQIRAAAATVPFLAERRLVILRGLLGRFERRGGRRDSQRATPGGHEQQLKEVEEIARSLPETTDMVLVDGRISRDNPLLRRLAPLARVREFPLLRGEALRRWVMERVRQKEAAIGPGAVRLLCDLVGGNLWAMDGELEKLTLYCGDRPIGEEDVRAVVPQAREAGIFAAMDALLEGRAEEAMGLTTRLLASGEDPHRIMAILAWQLRQLVLAGELLSQGASRQRVGQQLGIASDSLLRKTVGQARRYSLEALRSLYRRLVELDMAIKTGQVEDELGLQLLVAGATAGG